MAKVFLPGTAYWGQQSGELTTPDLIRRYEDGFAGVYVDEDARRQLWADVEGNGGYRFGSDAATDAGWAGEAAGQLVATWTHVEKTFPGCWPGSAQTRGDCVSHSTRNAALTTLACEIAAGKPDEQTGKVEGVPDDLPEEGRKDGVLSTEAIYWWRDHGGDGWSCDHAASVVLKESGMWLRKKYDEFGVDLTRYSGNLAGKWGARNPPDEIRTFGTQHAIRTATEVQSFEEVRDFLANGYGISTCGGEGWSSSRDENGFSRRQGGWSHALAYIGADDRDVIKQKYGEPLVCVLNSWGRWNTGGRRVLGTGADIPEGAFWAKWSDCKNRYMIAFASAMGWPRRKLTYIAPALG